MKARIPSQPNRNEMMMRLQNQWKALWMALWKKKQKKSLVFWKIKPTKMRINKSMP